MNIDLKKIEDECVRLELWLFGQKKELDQKRLEAYDLLKKVSEIREESVRSSKTKGGRRGQEDRD